MNKNDNMKKHHKGIRSNLLMSQRSTRPDRIPLLVQILEDRVTPATFVVNSTQDLAVDLTDAIVTLRDAITAANTNVAASVGATGGDITGEADNDVIVFDSTVFGGGATITLSQGDLLISDDLILDGATGNGGGATTVTIDGGGASRLFVVNTIGFPGTLDQVTFESLILQNGNGTGANTTKNGKGGAIFLDAGSHAEISDSTIQNNTVTAVNGATDGGGGVYSLSSELEISNTSFTNNIVTGTGASGGGIFQNGGTLSLIGSTVGGLMGGANTAVRAGGGIEIRSVESPATTTIDSSDFVGNTAGINGGGLHIGTAQVVGATTATVTVTGGNFTSNVADSEGGGLWNDFQGKLTITDVKITQNSANGDAASNGGGGVFSQGSGLLTIENSKLNANKAGGTLGSGGGVLVDGGTVIITNSTISKSSANRAGGGIEISGATNPATATLTNLTVDGNSAGINGGGVHISTAQMIGATTVTTTVIGGTYSNNTAANEGGGLWNDFQGDMTIDGATISNNSASGAVSSSGGGGVFSQGGGTLTIMNAIIDGNMADGAGGTPATSGSGGGILVDGGTLILSSTTLSNNTAVRAGGGLELNGITNVTAATITDAVFTTNATGPSPGNGGGIHITTAGVVGDPTQVTATVTNGTFDGNTASNEGGGLWNDFQGELTIDGSSIVNNVASGKVSSSGGGGVFSQGGALTITNSTIDGNKADGAGGTPGTSGSGGGILVDGGTLSLSNSTLSNNSSVRAGGGLELNGLTNVVTATITDTDFTTNDTGPSPGNGGGIHITTAGVLGDPTQVTTMVSGGTFDGNTASNEGGGLWNDVQGELTISGVTITNNSAAGAVQDSGGGGVFSQGGITTISNSTISGNMATGAGGTGPTSGSGGGILLDGGTLTVTGSMISGNSSVRAGGGIEISSIVREATVTISSSNFSNNTTGPTPGNGGGLHVTAPMGANPTTLNITGGTFISNVASAEGGGLWNDVAGTMTVSNVTIAGNKASGAAADQGGGGVFNNGGTTNITNSTIAGNIADGAAGSGGGILNDGGSLTVTGGTIAGNVSNRAGGGIEATAQNRDSVVELTDVSILGNTTGNSPGNGGGIHVTDTSAVTTTSTFTITNGLISSNVANQEGGGVWNDTGVMTITGTTIIGNTANVANAASDAQGGGGVFNNGGTIIIDSATISKNTIGGTPGTDDGGAGIFNDGRNSPGTITITNTTISENSTTTGSGNGGGILNIGDADTVATVTITGGTIDGNTAARAGGGIETNAGVVSITSVTVSGNTANINGGGLHVTGAGSVNVTTSTFSGNTALNEGGGLWNSSDAAGTISVDSSTISGNTAKFGGGLFNDGTAGTISLVNSTVSGNKASIDGGGIDDEGGTLNVSLTTITNNTAVNSGGINADTGTTLNVTNSIVAGNTATTDADTNATISTTFNFVGGDPMLGALQDNGGPTFTHAPLAGSPVVDAGDPAFTSPPDFDQRGTGFPRVIGTTVDLGSVETDPTAPAAPVVTAPAAPVTVDADTFDIMGTAEADSLVQIFRDVNGDGMLDAGDKLVGSSQLTGGATAFTVSVPLNQLSANNFLVTATDASSNVSPATVVPTITEADLTAPVAPTVTAPAAPVTVDAGTFTIVGTAEVGSLVQIYRDTNGNGKLDTGETVVGSQQLGATSAGFSISVPLTQNAANNFLATSTDGAGNESAATLVPTITEAPAIPTGAVFAVGQGAGGAGLAQLYAADGTTVGTSVTPFTGFTGDVRVASADFNGDGILDLVVGTGPGSVTNVRILNGKDGSELFQVQPFESTFTGGVFVTVGDVDGDGVPDLAITPDEGGGPRVDIFKGGAFTKIVSFFAIDDPNFFGGARASIGDLNNDGVGDLIVSAGFGGGPRVAGFDGKSLTTTPVKLFNDFFVFEETLRNGAFVAVGDINGDGFADLIAGGGPGGGPRVTAFDGNALLSNQQTILANFFGGDPDSRGGIRLATKNLDGDTRADLIVGAGTGAGSKVTAYLGVNITPTGTPTSALNFDAFDDFNGGVFVG